MLRLVKIWQLSSCGKFMQHLETCLLRQLKLTEICDVFFHWMYKMQWKWNSASIKSLLLFIASLFIRFLVEKYVACQSRKSDFQTCQPLIKGNLETHEKKSGDSIKNSQILFFSQWRLNKPLFHRGKSLTVYFSPCLYDCDRFPALNLQRLLGNSTWETPGN